MKSLELSALSSFRHLYDRLVALHDSRYSDIEPLVSDAEMLFADDRADLRQRLEMAQRLRALDGGMGSINDVNGPDPAEKEKSEFFSATDKLLRNYWAELGNDHIDPESIDRINIGEPVMLVEGEIMSVDFYGNKKLVPRRWSKDQSWLVDSWVNSDITGMPAYYIRRGDQLMYIRHDALTLRAC